MPRLRPSRLQTTTSRMAEHSTQPTIHLTQRRCEALEKGAARLWKGCHGTEWLDEPLSLGFQKCSIDTF
jgi:hypothetical protein